jgi:hypothetical protein
MSQVSPETPSGVKRLSFDETHVVSEPVILMPPRSQTAHELEWIHEERKKSIQVEARSNELEQLPPLPEEAEADLACQNESENRVDSHDPPTKTSPAPEPATNVVMKTMNDNDPTNLAGGELTPPVEDATSAELETIGQTMHALAGTETEKKWSWIDALNAFHELRNMLLKGADNDQSKQAVIHDILESFDFDEAEESLAQTPSILSSYQAMLDDCEARNLVPLTHFIENTQKLQGWQELCQKLHAYVTKVHANIIPEKEKQAWQRTYATVTERLTSEVHETEKTLSQYVWLAMERERLQVRCRFLEEDMSDILALVSDLSTGASPPSLTDSYKNREGRILTENVEQAKELDLLKSMNEELNAELKSMQERMKSIRIEFEEKSQANAAVLGKRRVATDREKSLELEVRSLKEEVSLLKKDLNNRSTVIRKLEAAGQHEEYLSLSSTNQELRLQLKNAKASHQTELKTLRVKVAKEFQHPLDTELQGQIRKNKLRITELEGLVTTLKDEIGVKDAELSLMAQMSEIPNVIPLVPQPEESEASNPLPEIYMRLEYFERRHEEMRTEISILKDDHTNSQLLKERVRQLTHELEKAQQLLVDRVKITQEAKVYREKYTKLSEEKTHMLSDLRSRDSLISRLMNDSNMKGTFSLMKRQHALNVELLRAEYLEVVDVLRSQLRDVRLAIHDPSVDINARMPLLNAADSHESILDAFLLTYRKKFDGALRQATNGKDMIPSLASVQKHRQVLNATENGMLKQFGARRSMSPVPGAMSAPGSRVISRANSPAACRPRSSSVKSAVSAAPSASTVEDGARKTPRSRPASAHSNSSRLSASSPRKSVWR